MDKSDTSLSACTLDITLELLSMNDVKLDPNTKDQVLQACTSNNLTALNDLIEQHPEISDGDLFDCFHALAIANKLDNIEIVAKLLLHVKNINNFKNCDYQPLIIACQAGNILIIKMLVERGASPTAWDREDQCALYYATENNRVDILRMIFEAASSHREIESIFINNALSLSCMKGHVDVARYLIEQGADVNWIDYRKPMLQIACEQSHLPVAKLLLESGADPSYIDLRLVYETCVVKGVSTGLAQLFLDSGLDLNSHPTYGDNVFLRTVSRTFCSADDLAFVTWSLDHSADVNLACTHSGHTVLMTAARWGCLNLVQLLLERGADVTQLDHAGKSILDMTECWSHREIVGLCNKYMDRNRPQDKPILK